MQTIALGSTFKSNLFNQKHPEAKATGRSPMLKLQIHLLTFPWHLKHFREINKFKIFKFYLRVWTPV